MDEEEFPMNVTEIRRPADMERITTPELAKAFIDEQVKLIKEQVGDKKVLLALSGGVDSSVVAALLIKAIGQQLVCVHVNHGLLRKGEPEEVIEVFRNQMNANLVYVDATDRFLEKLAGVEDPETKRKIIGGEFIEVFAEEARKLEGIEFLAQGTIWPDILESEEGIKAHHNAGGLPEDMAFELVEPVRILFKDEVRVVGDELGLPHGMVYRQPFPGPGLGVRCPGAITRDRLEAVRESDAILREEFAKNGLEGKVWQYFTVVPYRSPVPRGTFPPGRRGHRSRGFPESGQPVRVGGDIPRSSVGTSCRGLSALRRRPVASGGTFRSPCCSSRAGSTPGTGNWSPPFRYASRAC